MLVLQRIILLISVLRLALAENYISATSLLTCMSDSQLTASFFDVKYTPSNNKINFDISAVSTINADIEAHIELIVYGITILTENIALCDLGYSSLCPMASGHIEVDSSYTLSDSISSIIPGIAYTIPDLDARVRVIGYAVNDTDTPLACVEAILSNGKTVQTKYAAWPIAAISGLGLIASGVISIVGHSNTAAHIASNSLSLFIYFQGLAITSMMAVSRVPPIAAAWAQNFVWALGIIKSNTIQSISNWYVQATGGSSTAILLNKTLLSISVQKRDLLTQAVSGLVRRGDYDYDDNLDDSDLYTTDESSSSIYSKILVLRGIQRVLYKASIEISNIFLTGLIFLIFFSFIVLVLLFLFKGIVELLVRTKVMREGKYAEYRKHWSAVTKGVLYRLALLLLPQVSLLCFWELTVQDSAACVVVAVCFLVIFLGLLIQAAVRLYFIARSSIKLYKNPAYLLFGDAKVLNRFGFLYVQFRADKYWWIIVVLAHVVLRSLFVAVLQSQGKAQSIIVFVIELAYFILLCWKKPYMDKRTNVFNILIATVNLLNSIFYVFFSNIFGQPAVVSSVMAVVLFVLNAIFSFVLLIFTIVTCVLLFVYKNPDTRYQPMKDDRVSFLPKTEGGEKLNDLELTALGATAMRGHDRNSMMVDSRANDQLTSLDDDSTLQKETPYSHLVAQSNDDFSRNRGDSLNSTNNYVVPTSVVGGTNSSGSTANSGRGFYGPREDTSYQGYQQDQRRGQTNEYNRGIRWN